MLIDTDQIRENATKVEGLEHRLKSVEEWLNHLKVEPVHKTPADGTMPAGEPTDDGSSGEPQGKVVTFSGDGFEYTCAPYPGEPVADDAPAAKKPGFNPFGEGKLVIANDSEETQTCTVTIASGEDNNFLDIVDSDQVKVKTLRPVSAGECLTRSFTLKPGQAFRPTKSGSYKIEAVK